MAEHFHRVEIIRDWQVAQDLRERISAATTIDELKALLVEIVDLLARHEIYTSSEEA